MEGKIYMGFHDGFLPSISSALGLICAFIGLKVPWLRFLDAILVQTRLQELHKGSVKVGKPVTFALQKLSLVIDKAIRQNSGLWHTALAHRTLSGWMLWKDGLLLSRYLWWSVTLTIISMFLSAVLLLVRLKGNEVKSKAFEIGLGLLLTFLSAGAFVLLLLNMSAIDTFGGSNFSVALLVAVSGEHVGAGPFWMFLGNVLMCVGAVSTLILDTNGADTQEIEEGEPWSSLP